MRNLLLASVMALLGGVAGFSQGQVTFSNFSPADGLNAKAVFQPGGVTSPPFTAQLMRVQGSVQTPVGGPVNFRPQAAAAGYVIPTVFTIDDIPIGGTASFRMVVLRGDTYKESAIVGMSNVSTVTLGGGTVTPPPLLGLTDISGAAFIQVPEPTIIAFGVIGISVFLFWGRKKGHDPMLIRE